MGLLACGLGAGQALMALARLPAAGQAVVAQAMGLAVLAGPPQPPRAMRQSEHQDHDTMPLDPMHSV
eukprot:7972979-Pyramimonas_sp.AAC.1